MAIKRPVAKRPAPKGPERSEGRDSRRNLFRDAKAGFPPAEISLEGPLSGRGEDAPHPSPGQIRPSRNERDRASISGQAMEKIGVEGNLILGDRPKPAKRSLPPLAAAHLSVAIAGANVSRHAITAAPLSADAPVRPASERLDTHTVSYSSPRCPIDGTLVHRRSARQSLATDRSRDRPADRVPRRVRQSPLRDRR